ncbi:MAG TPA: thymidine phosphorylase [Acidimicrobiales bacterium]|nr:thymidine phosphorylase [Acidimicrobiales bacterium]
MSGDLSAVDVIRAKRDGGTLSDEQVRWFIDAYTNGRVADEQASALLMAIVWRGMEPGELATWTDAMIRSGERLDLSAVDRPTVDKHSTGGVGDKISLPLVPLVAACGAAVPQLSGRGLGHTGGTLDKLEAVAGVRVALDNDEIVEQLRTVGCVICAASPSLAPADRKLYALRDVTATVESIPLIASSIMSKKIAEGTESLVLDVKFGSGAFMKEVAMARELAETMVEIGDRNGVRTTAFLTAMTSPLGRSAGNALEIAETLEVLDGRGPADVAELTLVLAREMLALAGVDADPAAALADGSARSRWDDMVRAQGGDPSAALPVAAHTRVIDAPAAGYLTRLDAMGIGVAAWRLGAGRERKDDAVSATAGVTWTAGVGDAVEAGEPLVVLHADDPARLDAVEPAARAAFEVGPEPPEPAPLVMDRIGS